MAQVGIEHAVRALEGATIPDYTRFVTKQSMPSRLKRGEKGWTREVSSGENRSKGFFGYRETGRVSFGVLSRKTWPG